MRYYILLLYVILLCFVYAHNDFENQTYLVISQPTIEGPFTIIDQIPSSNIIWTSMQRENNRVTIDVYDICKIHVHQTVLGPFEEVAVYLNQKPWYTCTYIDSNKRNSLMIVILSETSVAIAETSFSRCVKTT